MKTIRQPRHDQGWTQIALALRVGVQPHADSLWESGRRMPRVPQPRKLGRLYAIGSDEIIPEPADDAPAYFGPPLAASGGTDARAGRGGVRRDAGPGRRGGPVEGAGHSWNIEPVTGNRRAKESRAWKI